MRIARLLILTLVFALGTSACGNQPAGTATEEIVTPVATARRVDPGYALVPSNGIVTFTDATSGISLDYPEGWIMDQVRGGARSSNVFVFTNYFHIPALMDKIPDDETAIYLTILQPDPEATLAGMIEYYKAQWAKEGTVITSEENVTLKSGQPGTAFYVDSYLGRPYYYLFTSVNGTLVYIETLGDLAPVPAIALTVR